MLCLTASPLKLIPSPFSITSNPLYTLLPQSSNWLIFRHCISLATSLIIIFLYIIHSSHWTSDIPCKVSLITLHPHFHITKKNLPTYIHVSIIHFSNFKLVLDLYLPTLSIFKHLPFRGPSIEYTWQKSLQLSCLENISECSSPLSLQPFFPFHNSYYMFHITNKNPVTSKSSISLIHSFCYFVLSYFSPHGQSSLIKMVRNNYLPNTKAIPNHRCKTSKTDCCWGKSGSRDYNVVYLGIGWVSVELWHRWTLCLCQFPQPKEVSVKALSCKEILVTDQAKSDFFLLYSFHYQTGI